MPAETSTAAGAPAWARVSSLGLAVAGLAVSLYLTVEHYTTGVTLACPETGVVDCLAVTTSPRSVVFGIPVAVLGLVFFVAMTALTLPPAWRSTRSGLRIGGLGGAGVGVAWVIYLVYVELYIVDKICLWCTAVHVVTVALFAVLAYAGAVDAAGDDPGRRAQARAR